MCSMRAPEEHVGGIEAQADLKQFLKVVRPEWSVVRKSGRNNLQKVVGKLNKIGISDTQTFVDRISAGTINDELCAIDAKGFSRETLQTVKQQMPMLKALENADKGPFLRQTGALDPARSLLSKTRLEWRSTPALSNESSPSSPRLPSALEFEMPRQSVMARTLHPFSPHRSHGVRSLRSNLFLRGPRNDKKKPLFLPEINKMQKKSASSVGEAAELPAGSRIETRDPMWQEGEHHSTQQLGEEMLREQHALNEHASLIRQVHNPESTVRQYITGNIRSKLQQEAERQAAEVLSTQERFRNIRKNIETMGNTRRELSRFRTQLHNEFGGANQSFCSDMHDTFGRSKAA